LPPKIGASPAQTKTCLLN